MAGTGTGKPDYGLYWTLLGMIGDAQTVQRLDELARIAAALRGCFDAGQWDRLLEVGRRIRIKVSRCDFDFRDT